jgi:hypothetical protein
MSIQLPNDNDFQAGRYKAIVLFATKNDVQFFLGSLYCKVFSMQRAKELIDEYWKLKNN